MKAPIADMTTIHVLGDSHSSLFTGLHGVCPRVPEDCPQALPGFRVWHLGPYLAYSFGKARHESRLLAKKCVSEVPREARVLMWMGEIDCRYHVCRHASSAAGIRRVAGEIVERYVRGSARLLRTREFGFVTVPPPTVARHGNQRQPTTGTFVQREVAARAFNASLKRAARSVGAMVLDLYEQLSDSEGRPNPVFFADGVHADPRCLPVVLSALGAMGWNVAASDRRDDAMIVATAIAKLPPPQAVAGLPGGLMDARDARRLLIEHAAARCRASGARKIAIFGAGEHTRGMGWGPFERAGLQVECVLDDHASEDGGETIRGARVVRPYKASGKRLAFDAIVISSDAHEDVLMARAKAVYGAGVPIIPIYAWRT